MTEDILSRLRPHQKDPAARLYGLLAAGQNSIDLSDCGTGKTYVACAVAKQLQVPTLAVVPKITRTQWRQAAEHFGDKLSVVGLEELRLGRSGFGWWDNNPPPKFRCEIYLRCLSCQLEVFEGPRFQPCYCHPNGIHCVETKKRAWNYGRFNFHPNIRLLILDEAHRYAALDSLNADMVIAARRQGIPTLSLSATAACGPLDMRALGYLLGLHNLHDFYGWSARYGCGKIPGIRGWHWLAGKDRQKQFMLKLRNELIPSRGVRVSVEDIPNFPSRTVTPRLFDVDKHEKIAHLYAELQPALAKLEKRKETDANCEHPLTMQTRLLQKIELLKVPLMVELAADANRKGRAVGLFVNFSQTVQELRRLCDCDCVVDGITSDSEIKQSVDRFQDGQRDTIIINNAAGGVGLSLPDVIGDRIRVGYVMPPRSARLFRQLICRFHRENSKSPCFYEVLLAAETPEEQVFNKMMQKVGNLDLLNDGDMLAFMCV